MRRKIAALGLMLALACLGSAAAAQDSWTHRGRDATRNSYAPDGAAPAIAAPRFVATAPGYELVGQSAPVVHGGLVFVHAVKEVPDGAGDTKWVRAVLAFRESDGGLAWDTVIGDQLTFDSRVSATVDASRGQVLIGAGYAVTALAAADGAILWQSPVSPSPIVNSTVCIAGDTAVVCDYTGFGYGATAYGIDLNPAAPLAAGEVAWLGDLWRSSGCEAALSPGTPDAVIVPDSAGYLRQFALDGTPGWEFASPLVATSGTFQAGCTVVGGRVYAATYNYYGSQNNARLFCVDAATGAQVWNAPCERTSTTPIVAGGKVILAGGLLRYLQAAKSAQSPPPETSSEARRKALDVRPETRLSVAQRPAG